MATLERAIQIAAEAHLGQLDKGGQPYILHPIRVMLRMATEEQRIVAVLHDVVEDSDYSFENLAVEGFSSRIIEAVAALTKLPGESRLDAAHRAAANSLARDVKLADNSDNMDSRRIPNPTKEDAARLSEYEQVRKILVAAGAAYPADGAKEAQTPAPPPGPPAGDLSRPARKR